MADHMQRIVTCGRFQLIFVTLTQMTRFSAMWGFFIMMFGIYEPPWRCVMEKNTAENGSTDVSQSYHSQSNLSLNFEHNTTKINYNGSCKAFPNCEKIEFEPGSSTIVSEFGLICDKVWITSLMISIELSAVIPGAYLGGQIGERFGRRISLYGSTLLLSSTALLGIFSSDWKIYSVFSFFIGLGGGGIMSTAVVFSMEFLNPWWRAIFGSAPVPNVSQVFFTLVILWLQDWRQIHIACAIVSGVAFLGVLWVPESLRWLDVHGKRNEADKLVKRIYQINNIDASARGVDNDITAEMLSGEAKGEVEDQDGHKTYLDLFRDPYIRSITIKASIAWATCQMAYISMAYGIKSLPGNFYSNAIFASVSEAPLMLLIGPLSNCIGRRWSALSFMGIATASCGAVVLAHFLATGDGKAIAITSLALVSKACAATAWCCLSTMSVELYPTVVRNLGYGFLNIITGASGVVAPYLIPQKPGAFGVCFSIMTVLLIVSSVTAMLHPETKGKPLADVIAQAKQRNASSGGDAAPTLV